MNEYLLPGALMVLLVLLWGARAAASGWAPWAFGSA